MIRLDVPCNGCRLCCDGDAIRLLPGDDPTQYQTEPHEMIRGALMLAHRKNGECVYLGEWGCTIHDRAPLMCREFDCRNLHTAMTRKQATAANVLAAWKRGGYLGRRS